MPSNLKTQADWWEIFQHQNPVPQKSLDHFARTWTATYLRNPHYKPVPAFSRTVKPDGEDYFFAVTLNGPKTIPHYVCLMHDGFGAVPESAPELSRGRAAATPPEHPDLIHLITLAPNGLDGHPGVLHGGMSSAILDETIGNMIMLHIHHVEGPVRKSHCYTIYLNITYRATVPTGTDIMVRCWLVKKDGRKWTAMGQIVDEKGTVCVEADCLYVLVPVTKL